MSRTSTASLLLLSFACLLSACGSESSTQSGACYIRELVCEGCESTTESDYCGSQSECTDYCAVMTGRPTTVYCEWHGDDLCTTDLPAVSAPTTVCAIQRSFSCGGGEVSSEPVCDPTCDHPPGSNDYDAELDCLTEYGSAQGQGKTCDEALADLAGR